MSVSHTHEKLQEVGQGLPVTLSKLFYLLLQRKKFELSFVKKRNMIESMLEL